MSALEASASWLSPRRFRQCRRRVPTLLSIVAMQEHYSTRQRATTTCKVIDLPPSAIDAMATDTDTRDAVQSSER